MRTQLALAALSIAFTLPLHDTALAKGPTFVNKPAYSTTAGKKVIIYGSRSGDCTTAPSFSAVQKQASGDPDGKLSDAGVGWRSGDAQFCPQGRPVRLIAYTPSKDFKGAAAFVFWGTDSVTVTVK